MNKPNVRSYRRKLKLTKKQELRLTSWSHTCRCVYNLALDVRVSAYRSNRLNISSYELMKQLPDLRKSYEWINDAPNNTLQRVILKLDEAYKKLFKGGGFPKFKGKHTKMSIPIANLRLSENGNPIVQKMGELKLLKDAPIIGTPSMGIIVKESDGWFINIICKDVPLKIIPNSNEVGLDMGISNFCIDSNNNITPNPQHFKKYEKKLRIENRSLSRKKKGSRSFTKQRIRLSKLYTKIGNVRKDFLHKQSTLIAKENAIVYMENLNIRGMVRSNLSKQIMDAGWGMFKTMLEYKTTVVKVDPKYTSQICNACGAKDKESRISQSEFVCTSCGNVDHADINAAKNIMGIGKAQITKRSSLEQACNQKENNNSMSGE